MLSGHTDVVPVAGQEWASDPFGQTERVAGPFLAGDRHDIGMARQHDAAAIVRADRRVEIGLALAGAAQRPSDAEASEIIGDPADQLEVRARRCRVEGYKAVEDLDRLGEAILRRVRNSRRPAYRSSTIPRAATGDRCGTRRASGWSPC